MCEINLVHWTLTFYSRCFMVKLQMKNYYKVLTNFVMLKNVPHLKKESPNTNNLYIGPVLFMGFNVSARRLVFFQTLRLQSNDLQLLRIP